MMNHTRIITYRPELNPITGSINATLLMSQLEYWFERTEGQNFYKFLAPCEDDFYRSGDSWCEELGFSKAEFRCAFSRIGKVYTSKKDYLKSSDPFAGKLYLSYYDRIKHRTYYVRNHELLDQVLPNTTLPELPSPQPSSPITKDYSKDLPTKNTTRDTATRTTSPSHHDQIIKLYHELCPELPKVERLSASLRKTLDQLFETLDHNLERVRELFQKVHASDFLCGRLPHKKWRAHLAWLISKSKCLAILGGAYDTWSCATPSPAVANASASVSAIPRAFHRVESHNWDFDELDALADAHFRSHALA
ncbi:MAG: hypothetical protein ACRCTE_10950 [Cellulosilyticaceae bacterium]